MKKYRIEITGSDFTKDELQDALEIIANDIKHMKAGEMANYEYSNGDMHVDIIDESGLLNNELRELWTTGNFKPTYFKGEGQQSAEPERWEIYGDEGETYYYDLKGDYIHDCDLLGIDRNL